MQRCIISSIGYRYSYQVQVAPAVTDSPFLHTNADTSAAEKRV